MNFKVNYPLPTFIDSWLLVFNKKRWNLFEILVWNERNGHDGWDGRWCINWLCDFWLRDVETNKTVLYRTSNLNKFKMSYKTCDKDTMEIVGKMLQMLYSNGSQWKGWYYSPMGDELILGSRGAVSKFWVVVSNWR